MSVNGDTHPRGPVEAMEKGTIKIVLFFSNACHAENARFEIMETS